MIRERILVAMLFTLVIAVYIIAYQGFVIHEQRILIKQLFQDQTPCIGEKAGTRG